MSYLLDELRDNLQIMRSLMVSGDAIPMNIAQAIESQAITVLALITPKMRAIEHDFQRYQAMATLKIGDR